MLGREKNWRQERNQAVASLVQKFNMTHCLFQLQRGMLTRVEVAFDMQFVKLVSQLPSLSRRTKDRYATGPFQFSQHVKWAKSGKKSTSVQGSNEIWGTQIRDQRAGTGDQKPGIRGQSYGFMNQRQNSGINAALDLTNLRTLTPKIMFYPNDPKLPNEMFS